MAIEDQVPRMSAKSITNEATLHWGGRLQFTHDGSAGTRQITGLNTLIHNSKTRYFLTPQNNIAAICMSSQPGSYVACTDNGTLVMYAPASSVTGAAIWHYVAFVGGRTITIA